MPDPDQNADIILAGASVRSLAQSAVEAGLRPICIDLFCDADLKQLISEAGLPADNVRRIDSFDKLESVLASIDCRNPLVPVGGLEFSGAELDRIRNTRPVYAMPSQVIAELRNSRIIFKVLKAAGYLVPDFYSSDGSTNALKDDQSKPETSPDNWLKKDSLSSGGQSVCRIEDVRLQQHVAMLQPSEYLQQEVRGIPCSATFLVSKHQAPVLLGCAMQICGEVALNATGFQFCGNVGPLTFSESTRKQLQGIAVCLQKRWPLRGVFGIDFIWKAGDVFVIEVNPRLTASHEIHEGSMLHQSAHLLKHCDAFRPAIVLENLPLESQQSANQLSCRLILYSDRSFVLTALQQQRLMRFRRTLQRFGMSFWLSDIPEADTTIEEAAPFCSMHFVADEMEDLPSVWGRIQPQLHASIAFLKPEPIAKMMGRLQQCIAEIQVDRDQHNCLGHDSLD